MLDVPPLIPVISPVTESMVTTDVLPENHVPPEGVALSDVTVPSQIFNDPVMAGLELTVTIVVVKQPAASV
jgi:hypothetical protein